MTETLKPGTPLPWRTAKNDEADGKMTEIETVSKSGMFGTSVAHCDHDWEYSRVSWKMAQDNAAYIVEACNAYPGLIEDRDLWKQSEEICRKQYDKLAAMADELAEALLPFANILKGNYSHQQDSAPMVMGLGKWDLRFAIGLGAFRKAAAVLARYRGEGE